TLQLAASNDPYNHQQQQLTRPNNLSNAFTYTMLNPSNQQVPSVHQNYQQYQPLQENISQSELMLRTPEKRLEDTSSKRISINLHHTVERTHFLDLRIGSLRLRLLLFTIIWTIAASAQLVGMSRVVSEVTGESDQLKQRVAYWATACAILYGTCLFFLAQWFTKDLVWHWQTNHMRQLWGLQPSLASFSIGLLHIRMPLMIIFTLCLTLMSITSMVTNFWLTSSTHIETFNLLGPSQLITLLDIPTIAEDNRFIATGGTAFTTFVSQSGSSAAGLVKLTLYNGKYFWSPFLNSSTPQSVAVDNMLCEALVPTCTLLTAESLGIPYMQPINWTAPYNFTIGSYNFTIPSARGKIFYWGVQADQYTLGLNDTPPMGSIVYNVMARETPDFGNPTFIFNNSDSTSYVYATNCTVDVEWWNVTGTISSQTAQRLNITSAVMTDPTVAEGRYSLLQYFVDVYITGLSGYTNSAEGVIESSSYNLKSPLWMWMMGESYKATNTSLGVVETTIHPNMTNADWVELKLSEIAGGSLTPNTVAVKSRNYTGQILTQTSIIQAYHAKILGGVIVQSALLWIPIVIYIVKRKSSVFHGDDIAYLLSKDVVEVMD
ncbi:hypothetical protein BGZ49_003127, partial [Haplosporangium sp. Z 27]